ncbi:MAG: hypothetical protein AB8I08_20680 [Sandaracinaceae bacterium]
MRTSLSFLVVLSAVFAPLVAHAQDASASELAEPSSEGPSPSATQAPPAPGPLARAHALYDSASFEEVLQALARAEASDQLDRDQLIELLFLRALTHRAMGSEEPMRADLSRIAYIAPNLRPPSELPPSMRRAFETARADIAPLRLLGDIERIPTGVRYAVRASGDPQGLVRRTDAGCRAGSEAWSEGEGGVVELAAGEGAAVQCYASLVGLGGAELMTRGTRQDPLELEVPPLSEIGGGSGVDPEVPFVLAGVGVGLAAAVAAIVVLVLAPPPSSVGVPSL